MTHASREYIPKLKRAAEAYLAHLDPNNLYGPGTRHPSDDNSRVAQLASILEQIENWEWLDAEMLRTKESHT